MKLASYGLRVAPENVRPGVITTFGESPREVSLILDCIRLLEHRFGSVARQRASMVELLAAGPSVLHDLREGLEWASGRGIAELQATEPPLAYDPSVVKLRAPIPNPPAFRAFWGFEEHVKAIHRRWGGELPPEWREFPAFSFGNTSSFLGPDAIIDPPDSEQLDFELEVGCVIGCGGSDVPSSEAWEHVAGLTVVNGWKARDVEEKERRIGLGPAKAGDFATSLGPCLVTLDELCPYLADGRHRLEMTARINGRDVAHGNLGDLHWTFPEMIARASQKTQLRAGDIIGSGAVPTGCILELGPENVPWLRAGDCVELEVEALGTLRNWITFRPGR